jgi:hypothetical protein
LDDLSELSGLSDWNTTWPRLFLRVEAAQASNTSP